MKAVPCTLFCLAVVAGILAIHPRLPEARAAEPPFEPRTLRTEHPIVEDPVSARLGPEGRHLFVVTSPDRRRVVGELFAPDADGVPSGPPKRIELPANVVAYDVARVDPSGREALFFLTSTHILRYDAPTGTLREAEKATSIYRRPKPGRLLAVDFLRDRTDGSSLLVLPDFDEMRVGASTLPIPATAHHREGLTMYRPAAAHLGDMNLDGRDDLFFLDGDTLKIFPATKAGFSAEPILRPLGLRIENRLDAGELGDRDQSDVTTRRIVALEDFDGDGRPDLLIESSRRSGVLERETDHELHLGQVGPTGLTYALEPTTSIHGDAPLGGVRTADIDADGRLDLAAGSIDIGLGTIVSALLTGSVDFDVKFYRLGDSGYAAAPNSVREARIEFDLSEGSASIPVLVLADQDGDGDLDLVVREDQNELLVYPSDGSTDLFADEARTMEVPLPQNGQLVRRVQLNDDDADDLLVRYEATSGPEAQRTLTLLLGRTRPSP